MIAPQAAEYVSPSQSAESWAVRGQVVSTWETGCSWGPSDGLPSRSQSEHTNKCINYSHHQVSVLSPAKTSSNNFVTFHVRHSQGKMYIDHGHRCVCLSVPRHIPTLLHGPGCNLGCPLVVHYWADLQSVHWYCYYNNMAPNAKCQQVLAGWSLTSLFSINTAISETKGQGWKTAEILTSTLAAFLFSSHPKRERDREAHLNYYASAYNRGRQLLLHCKTKLNQIQQNTRKKLN